MPINLTLRSTKGSPLTAAEVDANFSILKENIESAIDAAGVITVNGRAGNVVLLTSDVNTALGYTPADSALVVSSFNGRVGEVLLTSGDVTTALAYTPANTVSPSFTGAPTAPTAPPGTNTTQLATTAFVVAATSVGPAVNGPNGYVTLPGGVIMQWGESADVTASGNQTVDITFPIPFQTAVYQVIVGTVDLNPGSVLTQRVCKLRDQPTLTGATIDVDSWDTVTGDTVKAVYLAIGR